MLKKKSPSSNSSEKVLGDEDVAAIFYGGENHQTVAVS